MTRTKLLVQRLQKHFPVAQNPLLAPFQPRRAVRAVDGASFEVAEGEVFGLLGESGCGKTTVGRAILRLTEPTAGDVFFDLTPEQRRGLEELEAGGDAAGLEDFRQRHALTREHDLRRIRRNIQIIFQDPHAALNPAMTVFQAVEHPLRIHTDGDAAERRRRVHAILEQVDLTPPDEIGGRYPSDLSGGQRQRVVIARAMVLRPQLVIADEPVAMLDMSIRARILQLLLDLKREYGLTYLLITHDLATARYMCDRVAVMYLGRIAETGRAADVFADPKHPYTRALIDAIPRHHPGRRREWNLPSGEIPDAIWPPAGCRFHPRCPAARADCGWEPRDLQERIEQQAAHIFPEDEVPTLDLRFRSEDDGLTLSMDARAPLREFLERERDRGTALMQAVEEMRVHDGRIRVRFRPAAEPGTFAAGGSRVSCVLYGPEGEG